MGAVCFSTAFSASALSLALTMVLLWKSWALTFLLASKVSMTSWYFHPTSWLNRPNEQNFLPGLRRRTLRADGTTILFFLSYGGGTPSKVWSLFMASLPFSDLCGTIPLTVRQKILEGARKWKGPLEGLTLQRSRKNFKYFNLFL